MTDQHPYLRAKLDPTARAPLGRTVSGLLQDNLETCHTILNALGVPAADDTLSLDAGLTARLTWMLRRGVKFTEINDDE